MYAQEFHADIVPGCYRTLSLYMGNKHVKSVPIQNRVGMDECFLCRVQSRKL
jgi:hypothetical protein